jgi:hypothetical protein
VCGMGMNGGFELFNGGWEKILHPCGFSKGGGREAAEDGPVKYAAHFTGERGLMADGGGRKKRKDKSGMWKGEPRSGRSGWRVAGGGMRGRRGFSRRHGEHGGFLGGLKLGVVVGVAADPLPQKCSIRGELPERLVVQAHTHGPVYRADFLEMQGWVEGIHLPTAIGAAGQLTDIKWQAAVLLPEVAGSTAPEGQGLPSMMSPSGSVRPAAWASSAARFIVAYLPDLESACIWWSQSSSSKGWRAAISSQ